jgi:hypothetical protein
MPIVYASSPVEQPALHTDRRRRDSDSWRIVGRISSRKARS